MKLLLIVLFLSSISSFKLSKVDRSILKGGLHRDMLTNFTMNFDKPEELQCELVIRENITKDIYIYLEEVLVLKGFQFWPKKAIDIERPSSASTSHEFIYSVPLDVRNRSEHEYIVDYMQYENKLH